ncbi:MAG: hypothetical protein LBH16_03250 [Treponema sp.]|jgi:hypothetical protein|nr:hypothetical protein [Treponema sp.]
MEIKINGQPADITVENEKTIGDVIVNLDNWLANSGHRLSGLEIDNERIDVLSMDKTFQREIGSIKVINIQTSSYAGLYETSLLNLLNDINEYVSLDFHEKNEFYGKWNKRAQAFFISEEIPDLLELCGNAFRGGSLKAESLISITEEMLREVRDPQEEFLTLQSVINDVCEKLISLPLDVQTGKDKQAAQTIQVFTAITEKIIRTYRHLCVQGYMAENEITQLIGQFGGTVKELLDAYEKHDSVLIGDLCEYEVAPRLEQLCNSIIDNCKKEKAGTK